MSHLSSEYTIDSQWTIWERSSDIGFSLKFGGHCLFPDRLSFSFWSCISCGIAIAICQAVTRLGGGGLFLRMS